MSLLERAATVLIESPHPASERWDLLTDCAEVAAGHNNDLARNFFQMAVDSAQGLDNNCVQFVHFQINLAQHASGSMGKEMRRDIAARLSRLTYSLDPFTCHPDPPLPAKETLQVATFLHPEGADEEDDDE